jgi:hypothetical protein
MAETVRVSRALYRQALDDAIEYTIGQGDVREGARAMTWDSKTEDLAWLMKGGATGILFAHEKYYVIVAGRLVGIWTKRRWAKRDLRYRLRHP